MHELLVECWHSIVQHVPQVLQGHNTWWGTAERSAEGSGRAWQEGSRAPRRRLERRTIHVVLARLLQRGGRPAKAEAHDIGGGALDGVCVVLNSLNLRDEDGRGRERER